MEINSLSTFKLNIAKVLTLVDISIEIFLWDELWRDLDDSNELYEAGQLHETNISPYFTQPNS